MKVRDYEIYADKISIKVTDTSGYTYEPSVQWGDIHGNIKDQGDLMDLLDRKAFEYLKDGTFEFETLAKADDLKELKDDFLTFGGEVEEDITALKDDANGAKEDVETMKASFDEMSENIDALKDDIKQVKEETIQQIETELEKKADNEDVEELNQAIQSESERAAGVEAELSNNIGSLSDALDLEKEKTTANTEAINTINLALEGIYTKSETDQAIETAIGAIDKEIFLFVESLPLENIKTNKIYVVPNADGENDNIYIEYLYLENQSKWEKVGEFTADADLSNIYTKDDVYSKDESDEKFALKGESYTKSETDDKYALKGESYTKEETDDKYALKDDVYSKEESDEKYALKGEGKVYTGASGVTVNNETNTIGVNVVKSFRTANSTKDYFYIQYYFTTSGTLYDLCKIRNIKVNNVKESITGNTVIDLDAVYASKSNVPTFSFDEETQTLNITTN